MTWILDNWTTILAAAGALQTLVAIIVKATPTPYDDELFRRAMLWFSFFKPRGEGLLKRPFSSGPRTGDLNVPTSFVALLIAAALASTSMGCTPGVITDSGTTPERKAHADMYLEIAEVALGSMDVLLVGPYQAKGEQCRELPTEDEYTTCMRGWVRALGAMSTAHRSIRAARAGLALSEGGDPIACVSQAIGDVIAAVDALDVGIPISVQKYLDAAAGLAGTLGGRGSCDLPEAGE